MTRGALTGLLLAIGFAALAISFTALWGIFAAQGGGTAPVTRLESSVYACDTPEGIVFTGRLNWDDDRQQVTYTSKIDDATSWGRQALSCIASTIGFAPDSELEVGDEANGIRITEVETTDERVTFSFEVVE